MQLSAADWTGRSYLNKPQKLQNLAAKLILSRRRKDSAAEALRELHWLNVETRMTFKILLIVHKIVIGHCPESLSLNIKDSDK